MRGLKLVPLLKREGRLVPLTVPSLHEEDEPREVGAYIRGHIDDVMVVTVPDEQFRPSIRKALKKLFPGREILVCSDELKFFKLKECELPIETVMRRLRGIG